MSLNIPYLPPVTAPGGSLDLGIVYFDDFITGGFARDLALSNESDPGGSKFSQVADVGEWLVTVTDTDGDDTYNVACADNAVGGWLVITNSNNAADKIEMQINGEAFQAEAGKTLTFRTRIKLADADKQDWFIGLAITDTDIIGGVAERIGFECPDATADIDAVTEAGSTQTTTDTGVNLADDTFVELGFDVLGTGQVKFYVNGMLKATHTTNITTDILTPSLFVANSDAALDTMTIDYILAARDR